MALVPLERRSGLNRRVSRQVHIDVGEMGDPGIEHRDNAGHPEDHPNQVHCRMLGYKDIYYVRQLPGARSDKAVFPFIQPPSVRIGVEPLQRLFGDFNIYSALCTGIQEKLSKTR